MRVCSGASPVAAHSLRVSSGGVSACAIPLASAFAMPTGLKLHAPDTPHLNATENRELAELEANIFAKGDTNGATVSCSVG